MPELPDVEVFRQYASRHALNHKIAEIEYFDERLLKSSKQIISKSLKGEFFSESRRKGKYLLLKCNSSWLVLHFGMTGSLKYYHNGGDPPEYAQLVVKFKNHHALAYISKRKLGKIEIARDIDDFIKAHALGEDALQIKWEDFIRLMGKKKGSIKNALMDQHKVSGIGNIYADEILFQEKIHPQTDISTLDEDSLKSLYNTMRRVMRIAIKHGARPEELPDDYLLANRSEGRDCPVCNGKIKKITVNGRGTYICSKCQKK
ncbi:MAG: Fpg/Nei family DNA glycosylase [Bacteroidales bacterium]